MMRWDEILEGNVFRGVKTAQKNHRISAAQHTSTTLLTNSLLTNPK